jgi:hypothetical protein
MNNSSSFAHSHVAGHVIGGGRYSLHVPLGESDLVWLAQDEVDQRLAAIRFFPADLRQDPRAMDALRTRIQRAAAVSHPGVARVIEWYEAEAVEAFVATDYVEGTPVSQLQAGGRVPWNKLQPVAADVAAALIALHQADVVHHAIEPANIVTTADGTRLLNAVVTGLLRNPLFVPKILAQPQELRFCSRDQLRGSEPAPADDIFSFGATLFELLTGTPVFAHAKHALASRSASREKVVTALRAVSGVPSEIVDFIAASLADDPAQRPALDLLVAPAIPAIPTVPERAPVSREQEAVNVEQHTSVPVVVEEMGVMEASVVKQTLDATRRRSRMPWLAAACVIICATVASGAWYVKQQSKAEKERIAVREAAALEAEQLAKAQLAEAEKRDAAARAAKEAEELKAQTAAAEAKARIAELAEQERKRVHSQFTPAANPVLLNAATEPRVYDPLPASTGDEGFTSIFNGRDLTEWTMDTKYWSVSDGAITVQCDQKAPFRKRFYLVSKQEAVQDFELQFSYRMRVLRGNKQPNGGVVYRATTNATPELSSYQFDVAPDVKNVGAVNEDKKRYRLAGYGENAVALSTDKNTITGQITDTNTMATIRPEDWNRCVIVVKGNQITHYVNGHVVANVVDENTKKLHKKGLLALELHTKNTNNPSTFIQFRDLKLKRMTPSNLVSSK